MTVIDTLMFKEAQVIRNYWIDERGQQDENPNPSTMVGTEQLFSKMSQ